MRRAGRFSVILLIAMGLQSQDLPVAAQAKFLKSLLSAAGQFGFAVIQPLGLNWRPTVSQCPQDLKWPGRVPKRRPEP